MEPEFHDAGDGWNILVWQDEADGLWYAIAENDALGGSGLAMPMVVPIEASFTTRLAALDSARNAIQPYRPNRSN